MHEFIAKHQDKIAGSNGLRSAGKIDRIPCCYLFMAVQVTSQIHGHSFTSLRGKSVSQWCSGTNEARVDFACTRNCVPTSSGSHQPLSLLGVRVSSIVFSSAACMVAHAGPP